MRFDRKMIRVACIAPLVLVACSKKTIEVNGTQSNIETPSVTESLIPQATESPATLVTATPSPEESASPSTAPTSTPSPSESTGAQAPITGAGVLVASASAVTLSNDALTITGDNLQDVTQVKLMNGTTQVQVLNVTNKSKTSLVATGSAALQLIAGTAYNLIISNAQGVTTIPLSVDLTKVPSGGLAVGAQQFFVGSNGKVGIGTATPQALFHVVGDVGSTAPFPNRVGMLLEAADGTSSAQRYGSLIYSDTNVPGFIGMRAKGTKAAPTAIQENDSLADFAGLGYAIDPVDSTKSGFANGIRGYMRIRASEAWSPTAQGTEIAFFTTPTKTIKSQEQLTLTADGQLGIGVTKPAATLDVDGTVRLAKHTYATAPACDADHDGSLARTSLYTLCICRPNSTNSGYLWVNLVDGVSACKWQ